ncbi:MAG: class I SAM-dependent methyltransferase [Phycisphaerales bacterium]|nr:class I SAM-dependent methyltransferase [Phycisphaerales bacterium]
MSTPGLYSDPMVYDILHSPGTGEEVESFIRIEQRWSPPGRRRRCWLEPACGSGRYLRAARARGIDAIGFDISPDMVDYAHRRARRARGSATETYFVASLTDFADHLDRPVTFAINPINTIRHLDTDEQMLAHYEQMARSLAPGACYCVGLSLSLYGHEQPSEDVWRGARGQTAVTQVVQFIPPHEGRCERVISHLTIERPGHVEQRVSDYTLRTYSIEEWITLIERSPLRLVATTDMDGSPMEPPRMGYANFLLCPR